MFDDEARMRELVSMDLDLLAIPRWQMQAILWFDACPELSEMLVKKYGGTKKEQREFMKMLEGEQTQ